MKRQEDDENAEQNIEELCQDRPGDEYFRLSSEGDCRDVVRWDSVSSAVKKFEFLLPLSDQNFLEMIFYAPLTSSIEWW